MNHTAMNHDPQNILERAVRITEQRSRYALEESLVATLADLVEPEAIEFYRQIRDGPQCVALYRDGEVLAQGGSFGAPLAGQLLPMLDPAQWVRLEAGEAVFREAKEGSLLLAVPIHLRGQLSAILLLTGERLLADFRLISGMVGIYRNFLSVIDEGERDTLTGLYNRKTFESKLLDLLGTGRTEPASPRDRRQILAEGSANWLAILDIDHFKRINDTYGHLYGDEVLLLFANLMKLTFRSDDYLFRYGGEEFVVVLLAMDRAHALIALERFRREVAEHHFPQVGHVTVSGGVSRVLPMDTPTLVVGRADQALYLAKTEGRDRIRCYEDLVAAGLLEGQVETGEIDYF
jgi:diguanylate cyclase (GGDEF)-like protein